MPVIEYSKNGEVGVTKTIKVEGSGKKPTMGNYIEVKWNGYVEDGRVLTESGGKTVRLGMRELWGTGADLGLFTMTVGERAVLTLEHEFSGVDEGMAPKLFLDLTLLAIINPTEMDYRDMRNIAFFALAFICLVAFVHWRLHG